MKSAVSPRSIARLLLLLGVFLAGAVLALILYFDLSDYRHSIEQRAQHATGMDIRIVGDMRMGWDIWRPSIILNEVVSNPWHVGRLEVTVPIGGFSGRLSKLLVKADKVFVGERSLGGYVLPISFSGDDIAISGLTGQLDDGKLEGDISYTGGRNLSVGLTLRGLDYKHVMPGIEGDSVDADINLKSAGATGDDLLRSLSGTVQIIGGPGDLSGRTVNLWGGDLLSSILSGPQSQTQLRCAVGVFNVRNGVARSKKIIIDTKDVVIAGEGMIDFVNDRLDMMFTPQPKNPSLVSLATPVRVSGHFGQVTARPDNMGMLKKFGGLALAAVNPAAALLPLMEKGAGDGNPCKAVLE